MTQRKRYLLCSSLFLLGAILIWPLPQSSLKYSKALYDKNNQLLSAITSTDEQWCFPINESIPLPLEIAIKEYEDAYMDYHPGINPISLIKAIKLNTERKKIIRGASTLAMQVMRMRMKNSQRTLLNKSKEAISALKYSLITPDKKIIRDWAEMAPFGGNVVGVKAASLRYFGRELSELSWAEYALLAVLPNSPGTTNLKINRTKILEKRNMLLGKLHHKGHIVYDDLIVYMDEDLPLEITAIPQNGYHLLRYLIKTNPSQHLFRSTINEKNQIEIQNMVQLEADFYRYDDIKNIAAVIIDIEKNELLAYVGNVRQANGVFDYVDIAQAPRSYGSLLKPFLYANALESGRFLPQELLADVPTSISDFQPKNFDEKYRGAVRMEDMVIQSLNVPAVRLLNELGLQEFYENIRAFEPQYLNKGAQHYGLSMILGGGEMSLWDLTRMYKGLAQNYLGLSQPYKEVTTLRDNQHKYIQPSFKYSPFSIQYTVDAMGDLTRPREEKYKHLYNKEKRIAWKTGTSYGHKDAWAIGFNGKYAVGVWVGNADGEGRYNLTGITKAAPILFKIFKTLPNNKWFSTPPTYHRKESIITCIQSGKMAGRLCTQTKSMTVEKSSSQYKQCHYHQTGYTNSLGNLVDTHCTDAHSNKDTFFVLPTAMDYYYKGANTQYKGLPQNDEICPAQVTNCRILYPHEGFKIFLPRETQNITNPIICKAHHHNPNSKLFWYVNGIYMQSTSNNIHEVTLNLKKGHYTLRIIDNNGLNDEVRFEILGRN